MDNCTALGMYKETIKSEMDTVKLMAIKLSSTNVDTGITINMIRVIIKKARMTSLDWPMNAWALPPDKDLVALSNKVFIV